MTFHQAQKLLGYKRTIFINPGEISLCIVAHTTSLLLVRMAKFQYLSIILGKRKKLLANRKIIMVYWKHSHVSYMFFKDQLSFFKAYLLKCRYAAKLEMVTPHSSILWHLTLSLHI